MARLNPEERVSSDGIESFFFCSNQKDADECAQLVVAGTKRATCSLLWDYEAEGDPLPKVGDLSIVTDFEGAPKALIRVIKVNVQPFNQIDAAFAFEEGEGDRSYDYWKRVHWAFFSDGCAKIGCTPDETMPIVQEWFEVIYA